MKRIGSVRESTEREIYRRQKDLQSSGQREKTRKTVKEKHVDIQRTKE